MWNKYFQEFLQVCILKLFLAENTGLSNYSASCMFCFPFPPFFLKYQAPDFFTPGPRGEYLMEGLQYLGRCSNRRLHHRHLQTLKKIIKNSVCKRAAFE